MTISFDIPSELEQLLRREMGDLGLAAKEAFLIEGYRRGRLSTGDLASILGLPTKHEAERWLGARGVAWNYGPHDLEQDRLTLDRVLGPRRP